MLIASHEVKLHAQCYTWSDVFLFIPIHGVKLYA